MNANSVLENYVNTMPLESVFKQLQKLGVQVKSKKQKKYARWLLKKQLLKKF